MARVLKTYAGLDRNSYFLFLAQVVNSIGHFVHPFLVILIALFVRESAPTREQIEASFAQDSSPQRAEKGSLAAVLLRRPVLLAFLFIHVLTVIALTTLVLHLTGRLAPVVHPDLALDLQPRPGRRCPAGAAVLARASGRGGASPES